MIKELKELKYLILLMFIGVSPLFLALAKPKQTYKEALNKLKELNGQFDPKPTYREILNKPLPIKKIVRFPVGRSINELTGKTRRERADEYLRGDANKISEEHKTEAENYN